MFLHKQFIQRDIKNFMTVAGTITILMVTKFSHHLHTLDYVLYPYTYT